LDRVHDGRSDTAWDYQWQLTRWSRSGLTVVPRVNLVTNIGYGPDATHTVNTDDPCANIPLQELTVADHPRFVIRHAAPDRCMFETAFLRSTPRNRILYWLRGFSAKHARVSSR